jgi:two-component system phosphate regulon sensor histidine kinase PhoR
MNDLVVFFGLPDLILILLGVSALAALIGWAVGRRQRGESARRLAQLLDALPQGAAIVRADGRITAANAEARQLWGEPFPSKLEGNWLTLLNDVRMSNTCRQQSLDTPSGLRVEMRGAPLESGLVLFTLQDLTARQRQEALYRNFISNVSHELKTPLTVIQGHISTMGENPADTGRWQTSRRIVADEAARLTHLVENLLLLSRLEVPDFSLDTSLLSLEAIVEDAILQLSDLAEARNVSLNLETDTRLPRIVADRARLKQVFINLLDNAIKYNREGGSVTVRLRAEDERLIAQVEDSGEGIPPQDLPHIFEKMYRVERRRGRPIEGSGLGLTIVRRIVEQHGGNISVESRPDEGTTFTLALPQASHKTAQQ